MDNSESNRAIRDAVQTTLNQFADSVRAGFDGLRIQLEHEQTARPVFWIMVASTCTCSVRSVRAVCSCSS